MSSSWSISIVVAAEGLLPFRAKQEVPEIGHLVKTYIFNTFVWPQSAPWSEPKFMSLLHCLHSIRFDFYCQKTIFFLYNTKTVSTSCNWSEGLNCQKKVFSSCKWTEPWFRLIRTTSTLLDGLNFCPHWGLRCLSHLHTSSSRLNRLGVKAPWKLLEVLLFKHKHSR